MKQFMLTLLGVFALLALAMPSASFAQKSKPVDPDSSRVSVEPPSVPGQFIIKFKSTTQQSARQADLSSFGAAVVNRIPALDSEVVEFASVARNNTPAATQAALENLKRNPNIEYAEPNYIMSGTYTPNDPSFGQQWGWDATQTRQAWDLTQGSSTIVIAIVDSGIQLNHPDLDGKIVAGYDYVDDDTNPSDGHGHGTHVAGTAAAETNNSTGVAGMCPNCKLMPVRVLNNSNSGSMSDVASGIIWAADNGAKVINLSLGGSSGTTTLQNAVDYAWGKGVFLSCSAGNDNTSSTSSAYPGAYTNCFAVAATTSTDARSSFSNYGSWVEVAAPGSSIYSTGLNSGYTTMNGTSMASPHVAGLAGLLASQGLTNSQIRDRICTTADNISGTGSTWSCGRINAYKAVGGNIIINAGFESGESPWVHSSSGGYGLIHTTRPRTGSYSAYMGGYNSATETLYQTITVPSDGSLKFHWYMSTDETSGTYDYLRVRLYSTSGTLLTTLVTRSNANTKNAWVATSVSLASYPGQTVRLQFEVTTDSSLPTSFFIDDISVQ